jgi:GTP-binding protein
MKSDHSFVDEARLTVRSGDGGHGMASFRREKFVPEGGPNGGDGGRGGDVVLVADRNRNTLSEFHYRQKITAKNGQPGGSQGKTGSDAATIEIRLPLGTVVYDADEPEDAPALIDLSEDGERYVVARGGKGGLGNMRFKSSRRQAPDFALPGLPGEACSLRLSLKLLADVGLVGFPNAGKSTLLRRISAAKPRVASYPFTTLTPSLGVVERGERRIVVADIPGLIEGAADGAGLGHRFLRHVERTRVLVHLLDLEAMLMEGRDLEQDYDQLRTELERYQPALLERPEILVLSKSDLIPDASALEEIQARFAARGLQTRTLSGATGAGSQDLSALMIEAVEKVEVAEQEAELRAQAEQAAESQHETANRAKRKRTRG